MLDVLFISLPFSLFAIAQILSSADWLTLFDRSVVLRLSNRSRVLFILFCAVSGFCGHRRTVSRSGGGCVGVVRNDLVLSYPFVACTQAEGGFV